MFYKGLSLTMPVLNDLHQCSSALGIKGLDTEVIQYQQLLSFDLSDLFEIRTICFSHF